MDNCPGVLAVATRFFGKSNPDANFRRLGDFLEAASNLGTVHVAINSDEDAIGSLEFVKREFPSVDAFAVTPWGFTLPLNSIVLRATRSGAQRLLIASAEFPPTNVAVDLLLSHIDENTLVAGARFSEHSFIPGSVQGSGVTVPWNTFAVWNLKWLARFGFPLCGDAPFDAKQAAVEEVTAIALYQKLWGVTTKLVSVPGFYEEWNTDGWDAERLLKHQAKIASKVSRPASQLSWAELPEPLVTHV